MSVLYAVLLCSVKILNGRQLQHWTEVRGVGGFAWNSAANLDHFFNLQVFNPSKSDSVGTGQSGDQIPVGARLFARVQTGG